MAAVLPASHGCARARRAKELTAFNEAKLQAFLARVIFDLGAAESVALSILGDRLGIYRSMTDGAALTPGELAGRTGLDERYLREWLINQAAGGYVAYDAQRGTFRLPPEHAEVLARDGRVSLAGALRAAGALVRAEERVARAFQTGGGVPYADYDRDLYEALDRMAAAKYLPHLTTSWIPSLAGIVEKLESGARVAEVGCGRGAVVLGLAEAFPASSYVGVDTHAPSLVAAREAAASRSLAERVRFESALPAGSAAFDLVASFDTLHDAADPDALARDVACSLAADGAWLLVEPVGGAAIEDHLNPMGRLQSATSVLHCLPVSRAGRGPAHGALAGEGWLRAVVERSGLRLTQELASTPWVRVFEARH